MSRAIIPEVLQREPIKEHKQVERHNINLTQNVDNRKKYEIYNTHNETHNTTNNNQSMGFFRFLLFIVTLPFIIVYKILNYFYKKFNLREKLRVEQNKFRLERIYKKMAKRYKDVYDLEEVY